MPTNDSQRSFEARTFAVLDQIKAEQRTQAAQLVGITVMLALLGVGLYALGKLTLEAQR